ncbi:MAG: hypothetical protein WC309_04030 [Candidatus Paceibacterota bacterium]|jgi:hypothetical protein
MIIKIEDKTVSLKDRLSVGDLGNLGKLPDKDDLKDISFIIKFLKVLGWKEIETEDAWVLLEALQKPEITDWINNLIAKPKNLQTSSK